MSERGRLLSEVAQGPRDVRFDTLVKLMEVSGFAHRPMRKGGHGIIFQHQTFGIRVTAAKPKRGRKVNFCYVKECLKAIETVEHLEDADA